MTDALLTFIAVELGIIFLLLAFIFVFGVGPR